MPKDEEPEEVIEEPEESDLEEVIEEEEQVIDNEKFIEFLTPEQISAPVLEQVAIAPQARITDLEIGASQANIEENNKDEGGFKYSIGRNSKEEAKYIDSGNVEVTQEVSQTPIENLGKNFQPFQNQEIGFTPSQDRGMTGNSNIEKYTVPDQKDIHKMGKEKDMFKSPEVKYKASR